MDNMGITMGPAELVTGLGVALSRRRSVLLVGSPGVGKSDIVSQAAAAAGMELVVMHPAVSDPTDFSGMPAVVDAKAEFLPFGQLRQLIEADKPTVGFADDVGQASPAVQAALMQLFLAREIAGQKISDHVVWLAATNRRQDRAGVGGILEPVKSRFTSIIHLEPDIESWKVWALGHGVAPVVVAFLSFRPDLLNDFRPSADIHNSPCPRTWASLASLVSDGLDSLPWLAGAVGQAAAAEFLAFLAIWRDLPSIDGILLDPAGADVPSEPSALYAVSGALASAATVGNWARVMTYGARLPREFGVLLVRDAVRRDKGLQHTPEFVKWASDNADLLM